MAWTTVGNLRGPRGEDGQPGQAGANGVSVTSAAKDGAGNLILTLSNGATLNAGNVVGPRGADGTSVNIEGTVNDVTQLPAGQSAGDGYITANDGHLHVSDGLGSWTDVGLIRGPKGDQGETGATGQRGSKIFNGNGAPSGANTVGAIAGDVYMDLLTGDVYNLS